MMVSSDFKKQARNKLTGKWGKVACIILAYILISFAFTFIESLLPETNIITFIAPIAICVIDIPLTFGLVFTFFKLFYGEDVKAFDFLNLGFTNFKKAWLIVFRTLLKLIVPLILIIISYVLIITGCAIVISSTLINSSSSLAGSGFIIIAGIILLIVSTIWLTVKSYYYSLVQFVAFDNPDLTAKECVEKSKELMTNRRGKLFCLQFSFIGWIILSVLTLGIGLIWLIPYMQIATIAFYDNTTHKKEVEIEVIQEK